MDRPAHRIGARGEWRARLNLILWLLPPVVAACAVALTVAIRGLTEEAERFRRDVGQLESLRLAVIEVRTEAERTREAIRQTRLR